MYIDANNLYGCSMIGKLPTNTFKWLEESTVSDLNQNKDLIMDLDPEGDTMYVFEVDGEYPEHLHDSHNDYPMAIESKLLTKDQLSPYNRGFLKDFNEKFVPTRKLIQDFHDKKNYVCSLKNLQFFIKHGLVITKIHRVLTAKQESFMKAYIDFNSGKRQIARSKFKQDFFKLMNNIICGKFIESVRK